MKMYMNQNLCVHETRTIYLHIIAYSARFLFWIYPCLTVYFYFGLLSVSVVWYVLTGVCAVKIFI